MRLIIFIFLLIISVSKTAEIDSLKFELNNSKDTNRVKILIDISRHYLVAEPVSSYKYLNEALTLSNKLSYLWGQEKALANLSAYYRNIGELDKAKENAHKILKLKNANYSPEAVFDAYFAIAQIKKQENNIKEELSYYHKALKNSDKFSYKEGMAKSHRMISDYWSRNGNFDSSLYHINLTIKYYNELELKTELAGAFNTIATTFARNNFLDSSIYYFNLALDINKEFGTQSSIADNYSNIALVYYFKNDKEQFISYSLQALTIYEEIKNKVGMASKYSDISVVYSELENYLKAIEFAKKAIDINKEIENPRGLANSYNNIANYYKEIDSLELAINYYNQAIELADKIQLIDIKAQILFNLGIIFKKQNDFKKAEENYLQAEKITLELRLPNKNSQLAYIYTNLADLYKDSKRINTALDYLFKAEELADKEQLANVQVNIYDNYSQVYDSLGNYTLAYKFHKQFTKLKDSLNNVEKQKIISELNTKYETEKKEQENIILLEKNKASELEKENLETRTYSLILGILLIIILLIILYNRYRLKQKSNLILEQQKQEITDQKNIVDKQNEEILSSIRYAERIQNAILPFEEELKENFKDHFIFYKPKDIVSGDFYWFAKQKDILYFATVDCTGHGIPGAMLSLIGNMLLNEALTTKEGILPSEILNFLDERIKVILNQQSDNVETQDGMDMNLIMINDGKLTFAGARRPLLIYTDKLETLKGTRMSIGGKQRGRISGFEDEVVDITSGMKVYLFTDGILDQMGMRGKKFGSGNVKAFIEEQNHRSMDDQFAIFSKRFEAHVGYEEQRDDITFVALEL